MQNWLIKFPAIVLVASLTIVSCKSAQSNDPADMPKDISERPVDENSQKYDEAQLDKMKEAIESFVDKEKCNDPAGWAFSPIGTKACGGPVSYIPYPKKNEEYILTKIEEYTAKMSEFNKKYSITSDCMLAAEPKGVKCQSEKAVLIYP
ncbi:hypothetical protein CHRY9390_02161 [Chryseobacterium aquaeductus]|uniref:Uncharacterized protein n=1 Tax=Chryseobacterium aquaeductus TaxID=2675056 RepID=A0A9N8MGP8_9FLAO|nr:hypothetical protein [Chryseobacterium aquaeductus]CAA7331459.1 hypothetical protein CHRY9390_02161 [Chryseobacterium potabilaquae]CAD7810333.1 hypothetical protein CHRY9390_02161 [Chryseobacterium aquaeductus]